MRIRITRALTGSVDGIDLSKFLEGLTYDVGTTLGNYLLAQRWAEPASLTDPAAILPLHRTIDRPGVLIVDDDEDMRTILLQLLDFRGWAAYAASDGIEGLAAVEKYRPSLILLDLAMPRMNGIEFRIRQRQMLDRRLATIPVVVVSALDAAKYKQQLNAAEILIKPFDADRLMTAVESHVRPPNLFRS